MRKPFTLVLLILAATRFSFASEPAWDDIGSGRQDFHYVLAGFREPGLIYAASGSEVLASKNSGVDWKSSGVFRKCAVSYLAASPIDPKTLFAATSGGLYVSKNRGENWRRAFKGRNYSEAQANAVDFYRGKIFLATNAGLFISRDNCRTWQKANGKAGQETVLLVAHSEKSVFAVAQSGAYKSADAGESWQMVFSGEKEEEQGSEEATEEAEESARPMTRYLAVGKDAVYLATDKGAYVSVDDGQNWERLASYGLLSEDVRFVALSPDSTLFCVAGSGVYKYNGERWEELSLRLTAQEIRFLAVSGDELYVACKEGLFKMVKAPEVFQEATITSNAPDIRSVQQAAIDYAEVNNEKIKKWRKQAARKALLPQVSVGLDRNATDLWHWEGGSTTKCDDDTLRRGRDTLEWDVRLSWDLGEMIWNDDQTSIDVRSRLLVELRDDILDQVTKLYFERIRVSREIGYLAPHDGKRSDKELRLAELTAQLDGMTDGYFSRNLAQ